MAELTGSEILAKSLKNEGTDILFFLMGGPMLLAEASCIKEGIRPLDVRHEQSAAFMAQAYSRLLQKPSVCMAASGPGTINLTTGVANALIDCCSGGRDRRLKPDRRRIGRQVFQEIDQLAIMKPCTKWADRVYNLKRIPEQVNFAFQKAMSGKPGPGLSRFSRRHSLRQDCRRDRSTGACPAGRCSTRGRSASPSRSRRSSTRIAKASKPIILSGSGVIWSQAWPELQEFVEETGIPFYTTPQGRGVVPDDHEYSYLTMRSAAFRDADLIIVVGTRMNYIIGHAAPPALQRGAKIARIDIDADEIATAPRKVDIGIVGDCKAVLRQLIDASGKRVNADRFSAWRRTLADGETAKRQAPGANKPMDEMPIHPLRLCDEVKNFMQRDAILVVDGQEILNFGRQSMPTFSPAHRLNSGPFGTMGVGLPFGIGAKIAKPDKQVIVVHGDGSFGLNALELDTAVRHNMPILVVISLNGGWTADPDRNKPGRNLGYTRFDKMAETLGCYGEYVERPDDIRPALDRAQREVDRGSVALVNVKTDDRARAATAAFAQYST